MKGGERGARTHWRRNGQPKKALTREEAAALREILLDDDLFNGVWNRHPSFYECSESDPQNPHYHVGNWTSRLQNNMTPIGDTSRTSQIGYTERENAR